MKFIFDDFLENIQKFRFFLLKCQILYPFSGLATSKVRKNVCYVCIEGSFGFLGGGVESTFSPLSV